MRLLLFAVLGMVLFSSCSTTYYVVRHAEKGQPVAGASSNDPPLSEMGQLRALALRDRLRGKKIGYIYSTRTIRTESTAAPTRDFFHLQIQHYPALPPDSVVTTWRRLRKNVLIVGHSNTVDDVVNLLSAHRYLPADLDEREYDNLFILRRHGKKIKFSREHF